MLKEIEMGTNNRNSANRLVTIINDDLQANAERRRAEDILFDLENAHDDNEQCLEEVRSKSTQN